ncbi:hypothetical protein HNY73_007276 [Argiope bruennichi]|uniref:Uncharacterized protein n=1 Tax=Argiope bruennichi TaxID=94029 RepID=A0A8T0FG01_ARGBR|nr:hypothetical protein HNY73_007276 [Argiope bruennichi]
MATKKPEMLDILDAECQELYKYKELLEGLYYTCGATELAVEHLSRPCNPTGIDYNSVNAQMKNLKDILDKHMQMVRLIFINVQKGEERLQKLRNADDPELVKEVNRLRDIILDFCRELRSLIKQGASICRKFHIACKIVLEYIIKSYCEPQ